MLVTDALKDEVVQGAPDGEAPKLEPSERVLRLWQTAQAVCFDVDCTLTLNDGLDLLAEYLGVGEDVARVTNAVREALSYYELILALYYSDGCNARPLLLAMDGSMSLEEALAQRLEVINCTPQDIQAFLGAHPPDTRLTPGAKELIKTLQDRGIAVYMISGGFRELCLPIAKALGVPYKNVWANRMQWQIDDDTGMPTKLVGFDLREPTAHQLGKPQAIAHLRDLFPYETVAMVGDGITDLEAVQITRGADVFVGFGGVARRQAVMAGADWFVDSFDTLRAALQHYRVAMIGSGAWACSAVKLVASNTVGGGRKPGDRFIEEVRMWVYEEEVEGRKLTEVINERHENVKYLPSIDLGSNVKAVPSLEEAVAGANVLIFCAPHQFIGGIVKRLSGVADKNAIAISLTKGMRVRPEGPQLISELVRKELGLDCSVLMGANIAADIAKGELSEATIGYNILDNAKVLKDLFETDYFYVTLVNDVVGAEMCGTLKNIVALAAGFVEGLGLGPNTKAAVMRAGLNEMRRFAKALYPSVRDETFFESCGVADLIATCYGGRNRLVAREYARREAAGQPASFQELEASLLAGQKLQGVLTSEEVQAILHKRGWAADYPLFTTVNRIVRRQLPVAAITSYRDAALQRLPGAEEDGGEPGSSSSNDSSVDLAGNGAAAAAGAARAGGGPRGGAEKLP
ncbi:hypothetical protein N2152v2_008214 [Parachlorella kessleri]